MTLRSQLPAERPAPSYRTWQPVTYARVMGERISMNREGLTRSDRTDPVPVRYADMSRPDRPAVREYVRYTRPVTAEDHRRLGVAHSHPDGTVCDDVMMARPCELWKAHVRVVPPTTTKKKDKRRKKK